MYFQPPHTHYLLLPHISSPSPTTLSPPHPHPPLPHLLTLIPHSLTSSRSCPHSSFTSSPPHLLTSSQEAAALAELEDRMRSSQQLLTLKEQKMRDLQTSLHSEVGRGEEEEGEGWGGGRDVSGTEQGGSKDGGRRGRKKA